MVKSHAQAIARTSWLCGSRVQRHQLREITGVGKYQYNMKVKLLIFWGIVKEIIK